MATGSLSEMEELLAVVKAATGPDMVLDARIELELDPAHFWDKASEDSPPVTESIDAALALVERMLPGFGYELTGGHFTDKAIIWLGETGTWDQQAKFVADAATAPLAVLAALLTALIAQEPK